MSVHKSTLTWSRNGRDFNYKAYSRDHLWQFENGIEVPASAAPDYLGNPQRIDPETALVAALSSCHMLTFLWVASKRGFVVAHYRDEAVGVMTKNERGKAWVSKVTLAPHIEWSEQTPTAEELAALHHAAHDDCFIANSVTTEIVIR